LSAAVLRAVIDTNVFVTALLRGKASRRVYDAFLNGDMVCIVSDELLAELVDVLSRPEFQRSIPDADITELVTALRRDAILIRPGSTIRVCRDPKDDLLLDCALAGRADCLVTGDNDLLALHPFRGLAILRPADFLRRLS